MSNCLSTLLQFCRFGVGVCYVNRFARVLNAFEKLWMENNIRTRSGQPYIAFCLFSIWRTNDFFFLNGNNFSDQKGSVIGPIRAAMNIPWEQNCQRNVTCGCLKYAVDCETSKATEYSFLARYEVYGIRDQRSMKRVVQGCSREAWSAHFIFSEKWI